MVKDSQTWCDSSAPASAWRTVNAHLWELFFLLGLFPVGYPQHSQCPTSSLGMLAAPWGQGWFFIIFYTTTSWRMGTGVAFGVLGSFSPRGILWHLPTGEEKFQVDLGPGASGQGLRRAGRLVRPAESPRPMPWSPPSLPPSGLSLPSICCRILCKEPLLGLSFSSCNSGRLVPFSWSDVGTMEVMQKWKTLSKL